MIVAMKKLSLLVFYKDYQVFLEQLREKGVVHIHENKKRSAEDEVLKQKLSIVKRIGEMMRLLRKRMPAEGKEVEKLLAEWSQGIMPADRLAFYYKVFYPERELSENISEASELDLLVFLESQFKRMEQLDQQTGLSGKRPYDL